MKLKEIYISNVLESYYRGYDQLSKEEKQKWYQYDFYEANRALLYGADNKAIITSYPINPEYLTDLKQVTGWSNVINLYPNQPQPSLSQDLQHNGKLKDQFVSLIKANSGVKLIQYRSTPEFHNLVSFLKKQKLDFKTPELIESDNEFVLNYYNTKRGFRHLWAGVLGEKRQGINIPEGFICGDLEEALEAAWWFRAHSRDFVIKYNRGVQGVGVSLNYCQDLAKEKQAFINQLKLKLSEGFWKEPALVVEELIPPDHHHLGGSPNVELFIDEQAKVHFSYPCEQILENNKKFIGVKIHPELMNFPQMQSAKEAGLKLGQALAEKGYRGCFDIDMVVDKGGRAFAVEANLRRTGGTHLHELGLALFGLDYYQQYYLYSLDLKLTKEFSYEQFKTLFKNNLYDSQKQLGLLLANADMLQQKILVPIIIAKSQDKAEALYQHLREVLQKQELL